MSKYLWKIGRFLDRLGTTLFYGSILSLLVWFALEVHLHFYIMAIQQIFYQL